MHMGQIKYICLSVCLFFCLSVWLPACLSGMLFAFKLNLCYILCTSIHIRRLLIRHRESLGSPISSNLQPLIGRAG